MPSEQTIEKVVFGAETLLPAVNGGYIAASALNACTAAALGRTPLSITTNFLSPVQEGECEMRRSALVMGKQASCFSVDHLQRERLTTNSKIWLCEQGSGPSIQDEPMPLVPHPDELRDIEQLMRADEPALPIFWASFQQRPFNRVNPKERLNRQAKVLRWFRPRSGRPTQQSFVLPIIDVMGIPAAGVALDRPVLGPRGGVTTQLSVQFHSWGADVDWVLAEAHCPIATNGCVATSVKIWDERGKFLAHGLSQVIVRQTKAIES